MRIKNVPVVEGQRFRSEDAVAVEESHDRDLCHLHVGRDRLEVSHLHVLHVPLLLERVKELLQLLVLLVVRTCELKLDVVTREV